MATLMPVRQPFGIVDGSRLRNLASTKNKQAAIPGPSSSLKRRHVSPDNSDSENVDPELLKSSGKRKRTENDYGDLDKPTKSSSFSLTVKSSTTIPAKACLDSPPVNTKPSPTAPSSAPAAAGRSPTKSRRSGIPSTRRVSSSGSLKYTHLGLPAHGVSKTKAPLSVTAALNGTFSRSKRRAVSTLEEAMPKAWDFKIYEDTEEEHAMNLMGHSTITLDISDDEGRCSPKADHDDKENIPPGFDVSPTISPRARDATESGITSEIPRSPLGDLRASDFYAPGCDATSFVLVPGDDGSELPETNSNIAAALEAKPEAQLLDKEGLERLLKETAPAEIEDQAKEDDGLDGGKGGDIEIWESGSAKDEAMEEADRKVESIFAV